jgi:hypothetical protein
MREKRQTFRRGPAGKWLVAGNGTRLEYETLTGDPLRTETDRP